MGRLAGMWLLSLLLSVVAAAAQVPETEVQSSYVVHVAPGHAPRSSRPRLLTRAYTSFLRDQLPTHLQQPEPRLHYSYAHAATGFAAGLTRRQAEHLASLPSVLAVVPDKLHRPHTTLTPSFLGLSSAEPGGLLPSSNAASDVVIGVIDSGIYPKDRASFAAHPSMTPPPAKFRGSCVSASSFNASAYCNNKLVGAKFFSTGYEAAHGPIAEAHKSPLDTDGHGTHTASTAAGSAVADASFFDYAKGEAVGMAPGARIAAYNVDNAGDVIKDLSTGQASTPFVRGSGHVDPNRALDPGLVYDAGADDYVSFLCALGYTDDEVAVFTKESTNCSMRKGSVGDLNYLPLPPPSFVSTTLDPPPSFLRYIAGGWRVWGSIIWNQFIRLSS